MADNDLQEFERSLAQLEYMADKATPESKRQSNTRNTESRTKHHLNNDNLSARNQSER